MKLNIFIAVMFTVLVSVLSGCAGSTGNTAPTVENTESAKTEVELVPARKSDEDSSKTVVVERDGKYYELLKEHERICSDCDK